MITISAVDNYNFPGHKDLFLKWPEIQLDVVADSYYLILDDNVLPHEETFNKALICLKQIIFNWQQVVLNLKDAEIIHLPFDFSDEYVGFLKTARIKDDLTVSYGFTRSIGGYSRVVAAVIIS